MRRRLVGAIFLFVFFDAMALQARGPLLASFEAEFGVSEGLLGLVAPAGTLGFVLAVLVVGLVAGRVRLRRVLLAGTLTTAGFLVVMGIAPVYWLFLLALLGQGAATGVFRGADRVILSHLYPARRGRIFTLYSLAWAIGAVIAPLSVSVILRYADWRATFLLLGAGFLPVAALLWTPSAPAGSADERPLSITAFRKLLRRPPILGTMAALLFVGGIEGALFTWLPYYAGTFLERDLANAVLSLFLLGYVPGRLAYVRLVERVPYLTLTAAIAALLAPVLGIALSGTTGPLMFATVFLAGALVSGLFPTLSAYGVDTAPAYSGPVSALTTGASYVGLAAVPMAMGVVAERRTIGLAVLLPVGLTAVLFALVVGVRLWTGTADSPA